MCAVLTPKRYALIRHLRQHPAPSIRALARDLGRDVKRVHQDVVALEELGLIARDRKTGRLSTDLDEITSTIRSGERSVTGKSCGGPHCGDRAAPPLIALPQWVVR